MTLVTTTAQITIKPVAVEELIKAFLSGRKPLTIEAYGLDLKAFAMFLGFDFVDVAVDSFIKLNAGEANHLVLKFKNHLHDGKIAPSSINRKLATIRSLVKLARTLGLVTWTIGIQNLKVEKYRDTSGPPLAAFKRMLELAGKSNSEKSARDRALLRLLFDLALRAGEAVSIDLSDYDPEASTLAVLGKGRSQKELLTLPETSKAALDAWIIQRGNEPGPMFTNFDRSNKDRLKRMTRCGLYQAIRTLAKKAGIKTRPHGLRHLSITEAIRVAQNNGYGIEEVLDHSRHRSVATLMIYRDKVRNVQGKIANLVANSLADDD